MKSFMKSLMKKYMVLSAVLMCAFAAQAQIYVRGINVNDKKNAKYIIADFYSKLLSNSGYASVDFGQNRGFAERHDCESKDGDRISFNSHADLINYFSKNGWDYMQSYQVGTTGQGASIDTRFIFKRTVLEN